MMKKLIIIALLLLVIFPSVLWATDSMTVAYYDYKDDNLRVIKIDWVDSPALTMESQYSGIDSWIQGWSLFKVQTKPGSASAQPDDDYDITITDAEGHDIMGGELADRDESNTEEAVPKIDSIYGPQPNISSWTITVSGQTTAAGTGEIYMFFSRY
jgi:hypothetical protein